MRKLLIALGVGGGALLLLRRSRAAQPLSGLGDAKHQLYAMPRRWWIPDPGKAQKDCYQSKTEALIRFAHYNARVINNYSGIDHSESPAEFDAINAKHGLTGKNRVTNISEALWVSMPPGRPYCLTRIDLETLNATSPAREDPTGVGFQIPDYAEADQHNRDQREHYLTYQSQAQGSDVPF